MAVRSDLKPDGAILRPYLRPERADSRPERTGFRPDRSPKGNMWSAIPVALLCMVVSRSERKQGSGPKGDEVL